MFIKTSIYNGFSQAINHRFALNSRCDVYATGMRDGGCWWFDRKAPHLWTHQTNIEYESCGFMQKVQVPDPLEYVYIYMNPMENLCFWGWFPLVSFMIFPGAPLPLWVIFLPRTCPRSASARRAACPSQTRSWGWLVSHDLGYPAW